MPIAGEWRLGASTGRNVDTRALAQRAIRAPDLSHL